MSIEGHRPFTRHIWCFLNADAIERAAHEQATQATQEGDEDGDDLDEIID